MWPQQDSTQLLNILLFVVGVFSDSAGISEAGKSGIRRNQRM